MMNRSVNFLLRMLIWSIGDSMLLPSALPIRMHIPSIREWRAWIGEKMVLEKRTNWSSGEN